MIFFFNWDSLHAKAKLNSHHEAWNYKKNKHKNIKAYITGNLFRKNLQLKDVCQLLR